jgi:pimeloyl-ACP methyl ester carboxylesterase
MAVMTRRGRVVAGSALAFVGVALALAGPLDRHVRAAGALMRFGAPPPEAHAVAGRHQDEDEVGGSDIEAWVASYRTSAFTVDESVVAGRPLRTYRPVEPRGQLVVAHGMHPMGYDEPRLVALSGALAGAGLVVHTPDQQHLKGLSLDPRTSSELSETMRALMARERRGPLGVLAVSFAGGLALRAASEDPGAFAFVVPVGAHHNLGRVVRWFAGQPAEGPEGQTVTHDPHPYGVGLLVHADPGRFFPAGEAAAGDAALDLVLHDRGREANELAESLSPAARAVLQEARQPSRPTSLAPGLLSLLEDRRATFDDASPAGRLRDLQVPVMLLHGAADPIVPPTESLYLAAELPDGTRLLVSEALRHAETADTGVGEQLALVHFMAAVLEASE